MLAANKAWGVDIARAVALSILAGGWASLTRHALTQHCKTWRTAVEHQREAALQLLEDASWIRPARARLYRGIAARYDVNPRALQLFAAEGERHRLRRAAVAAYFGVGGED